MPRKLSWKEARELATIEARMADIEARLPEIDAAMISAGTHYARLSELQREREALDAEMEQLMERWLTLSEE